VGAKLFIASAHRGAAEQERGGDVAENSQSPPGHPNRRTITYSVPMITTEPRARRARPSERAGGGYSANGPAGECSDPKPSAQQTASQRVDVSFSYPGVRRRKPSRDHAAATNGTVPDTSSAAGTQKRSATAPRTRPRRCRAEEHDGVHHDAGAMAIVDRELEHQLVVAIKRIIPNPGRRPRRPAPDESARRAEVRSPAPKRHRPKIRFRTCARACSD
jgi:hypothetical protein